MYSNRITHRGALAAALLFLVGLPLVIHAATAVASITLTMPNKALFMGTKETLKATVKDSHGHAIRGVTSSWSSSKTKVSSTSRGVAIAKIAGIFKITGTNFNVDVIGVKGEREIIL